MNGSILGLVLVVFILILCFRGHTTDTAKDRYKKDLRDDRWKTKRKKILKRDNYKCVKCGCKQNLQVHHKYYERYPNNYLVKPWDYPDTTFITLCDRCHKHEHETRKIKSYYRKFGVHYE